MRVLAAFVLFLGLIMAGGAVYYMYGQFKAVEARLRNAEPRSVEVVQVAVAAEDLKFGQPLTRELVRMVDWPAEAAPENAFNSVEDLFGEGVASRTVLRRMEPGEAVLKTKVTGFGEKATVAALLDPGMRAFTLAVNAQSAVGGNLLPGARVDIYLTLQDQDNGPTSRLLMPNVEIIAIDQDTDRDRLEGRVAKTVTVQGDAEQVRQLTLAANLGRISLAMVGFNDGVVDEDRLAALMQPLDRRMLLGEKAEEVVVEEVEQTVRVRRAGDVALETIGASE
jgi:pilus assembly protein CpaB